MNLNRNNKKIVSASREDQANSATDIMNYKHNINIEKNNSHWMSREFTNQNVP